jgi:hypothetical protein
VTASAEAEDGANPPPSRHLARSRLTLIRRPVAAAKSQKLIAVKTFKLKTDASVGDK